MDRERKNNCETKTKRNKNIFKLKITNVFKKFQFTQIVFIPISISSYYK